MLKKFRRLFPLRNTVEIDVERVEPRVSEDRTPSEAALSPDSGPGEVLDPGHDAFIEDIRGDLGLQRAAQERIADGLASVETQLQPMAQQLQRHAESIASSERQVVELVGEFTRTAVARGESMEEAVRSLGATGERQAQVLSLLQQQLDRTQQSNEALGERFTELGSGLDSLVGSQKMQASRTGELIDAVQEQMARSDLAQRRLFAVSIALLGLGTLGVLAAVTLVVVYAP